MTAEPFRHRAFQLADAHARNQMVRHRHHNHLRTRRRRRLQPAQVFPAAQLVAFTPHKQNRLLQPSDGGCRGQVRPVRGQIVRDDPGRVPVRFHAMAGADSPILARQAGATIITPAGQGWSKSFNSTSSPAHSLSTAIRGRRAGFVVSRCGPCARRCGQRQTGNDSPWRPALGPCSHWQQPNRACYRA